MFKILITALVGLINLIIKGLGGIAGLLVNLLPPSPFQVIQFDSIPYIKQLNWIIPFNVFVTILSYWVGAIVLYYIVQVGLRWVKAIQ